MAEFATNGKGNLGVTLGAIGTGLGVLNGGLGNLLGGLGLNGVNGMTYPVGMMPTGYATVPMATVPMATTIPACGCGCNEDHTVNRYEAGQAARIAELETEVKLRDSNIYTDSKILDLYKYIDGEFRDVRATQASQAVLNQQTADSFQMVRNDIVCAKNELYSAIARERDERCCADNSIITYANATFYPKMIADVTVGTETTAQTLYNPLPKCGGCGCGC